MKKSLKFILIAVFGFGLYSCSEGIPKEIVGTYEGTLPCADCPGIEATIIINKDGTYSSIMDYLESGNVSPFKNNGTLKWNKKDSILTLNSTDSTTLFYKTGKNQITMLNSVGEPINTELAEYYILKKK